MNEIDALNESLARKIAGDIAIAQSPNDAMRKWRYIFKVTQRVLAEKMSVSASIISDYESGRRRSPGSTMIKKFVESLLAADAQNKDTVSSEFCGIYPEAVLSDTILDIQQLSAPRTLNDLAQAVDGRMVTGDQDALKRVSGYVIIDSLKAIMELSPKEIATLYKISTDKAVVFTNIKHGKSALVAIKAVNFRPEAVIFHGPKEIDPLAQRIADVENIPVVLSFAPTVDDLIEGLGSLRFESPPQRPAIRYRARY